MTLREKLLANKPKLTSITLNGETYFIRELTVGEVNEALFGQQQKLIKIAKNQGVELNFDDEEELTKQLSQIYDPHSLARTLAIRLCDEAGNNLFDSENDDDLLALSNLDADVFTQLQQAIKDSNPKNSPNADDSK